MQTKFIEENMDILHKYLLWKETILPSQIVDNDVEIPAEDVEYEVVEKGKDVSVLQIKNNGTSGMSEKKVDNYGIIY